MPTLLSAPTGPTTGLELIALIENLINWMFVGFMVLAALFVVLAALQFLTSRGDPTGVAAARTKLLWAVIGIGAAVLSKGFVVAIRAIIGG